MATAMLDGQERLAQKNAREFDKVFTGLNQGLLVSSELYRKWQQMQAERDQLRSLVDCYGADQWRRGNAGREPQEFAEWQHARA